MHQKQRDIAKYEDPLYWKQCDKKVRFEDRQTAVKRMRTAQAKPGKMLNVYKCRFCRKYHIGNTGLRHANEL
jgi:hypothetical protein